MRTIDRRKEIINKIHTIAGKYSAYEVFTDWIRCMAMSISNSITLFHGPVWKEREDTYMATMNKYSQDERMAFCEMAAWLAETLDDGPDDILGDIYMKSGMGSKAAGQFFTPFHLSELTARLSVNMDKLIKRISITFFFNRINKPYCDITADDIRMYIATRTQIDKVSKVTADNERRNISSFYTWLQKEEILLKNPMSKVDSIKIPKKKKMAFTQMDIEKMRYACQNTFQTALFEILLSTWARVSEVAQIKISEIDIEKGAVLVHGKGDKERTVYLNAKAKLAVENYLMDREDDNPYLFPKCEYAGDVTRLCHGIPRKLQGEWYKKKQFVSKEARHRDGSTIESDIRRIGKRAGVENAHPHRFRNPN